MPNYCVNRLSVSGSPAEVERFFARARGRSPVECVKTRLEGGKPPLLDFNAFLPYPKIFKEQDDLAEQARKKGWQQFGRPTYVKDGYNSGGCEWCCDNWGTRWNAGNVERRGNRLSFTTAWAPPTPVIQAAATEFSTLTFTLRYYEGGEGFKGMVKWKGGIIVEKTEGRYSGPLGG